MSPGRRLPPPGRRKASRTPYRRILAVCEGLVTEPEYLRGLKRYVRNPTLDIIVLKAAGVPKTLVDTAVEEKRASDQRRKRHLEDGYDEVWAVFDRDSHPMFEEARQKARDNHVWLAVSNPSFELWLLLHHQDQTAPLSRQKAAISLTQHDPSFDKHVDFDLYAPGLDAACERARELDRRAQDGDTDGNPTTSVHALVESIQTQTPA